MNQNYKCTPNENWIKDETLLFIKNRAKNAVSKHEIKEKAMIKKGFVKILVKDPTRPRLSIEKWIKK